MYYCSVSMKTNSRLLWDKEAAHLFINIVVVESGVVHDGLVSTVYVKTKPARRAVAIGQHSGEEPSCLTCNTQPYERTLG